MMRMFEWWNIPRRGWLIILGELCAIIGLSISIVNEYVYNVYFQSYVNGLAPVLLPVVSVAFGVASASAATILYFGMKELRRTDAVSTLVDQSKRRGPRKSVRHSTSSTASKTPKSAASPPRPVARLKPIAPVRSLASREASASPSVEEKEQS